METLQITSRPPLINELEQLNLGKLAIAKLKEQYESLQITDIEDKLQYKIVHDALQDVKKGRIGIEKFCKQRREAANAYIKQNLSVEKELIAELEPLETHLFNEREKVEEAKRKIVAEAERLKQEKVDNRIKSMLNYGVHLDLNAARFMSDAEFLILLNSEKVKFETEEKRKADEAAMLKAEADRQAAENMRLAAIDIEQKRIAKEQADKAAELQRKQDFIDAEQKAKQDAFKAEAEAKQRAAELEAAKKKAAEDALKADAEAKEAARLEALAEAEREEAAKPDKKKLNEFAEMLATIAIPELKSERAKAIILSAKNSLDEIAEVIKTQAKTIHRK